jgi:AcrR family transcriptional regulator
MANTLKRTEKNRLLKQDIVNKTAVLFMDKRFFSMTIREICEYIGISTGMFYRHFTSKNALTQYCLMSALDDLDHKFESMIKDLSLEKQLITYFKGVTECFCLHGRENIIMYLNSLNDSNRFVCTDRVNDVSNDIMRKAVAEGKAGNLRREYGAISQDILMIVKGICYVWAVNEPDIDPIIKVEDILTRTIDSLL